MKTGPNMLRAFLFMLVYVSSTAAMASERCAASAALRDLPPRFSAKLDGLEAWEPRLSDPNIAGLVVFRLGRGMWRPRIVDMRDLRDMRARTGQYGSPQYTMAELSQHVLPDAIIASGGLTQSLANPTPAGRLVIDSIERAPAFRKSEVLDGHYCVGGPMDSTIQSEIVKGALRVPERAEGCRDAVQAGPVLVYEGNSQPKANMLKTARVFVGLDDQQRLLVGFAESASTHALACVLTHPEMHTTAAIALQGDVLGGVVLGGQVAKALGKQALGTTDQTIASALVFDYVGKADAKRALVPSMPRQQRPIVYCDSASNRLCR